MTSPCVDAVVVAYRSADLLPGCMAALRADPLIDTITVIDHGDDRSDQIAREGGAHLVIADPTNPGFGSGQNTGAGFGENPYILLCNPDARMLPGAISEGLSVFAGSESIAAVQGVISDPDTGSIDRSAGDELGPLHLWARVLGLRRLARLPLAGIAARALGMSDTVHRVPTAVTEVESLAATAPVVLRSAFEAVGGFDDSYFLYGEDLDLCRRLRAGGWRLATIPQPWAHHREGASSSSTAARERAWWGGTVRFAAIWWGPLRWRAALVASSAAALRFGRARPGITRENWRVMVTEPRRVRKGHSC